MDISKPEDLVGKTVNKYEIVKYIASGSFGNVYEAKHKRYNNKVALKIPIKNKQRDGTNSLILESRVYKYLSDPSKGVADMKIIKDDELGIRFIAMDLLGKSLESMMRIYSKFELDTVILLAVKMIDTLRHIHSYGYIHRDLKPDNFAIGYEDESKVYCLDFGLAKKYIKKNGEHIDFTDDRKFVGTARYASINAHKGVEQSRRDDLESLGYILVYFFKGKLPWQGVKHAEKKKRYAAIKKMKEQTTVETLCEGMPNEFLKFFYYIKSLDFDEKPHYSALKKMFNNLLIKRGYSNSLQWQSGNKNEKI